MTSYRILRKENLNTGVRTAERKGTSFGTFTSAASNEQMHFSSILLEIPLSHSTISRYQKGGQDCAAADFFFI